MWRAGEMGGDRFPIARKGYDRARVDAVLAELQERVRAAEERSRVLESQLATTKARLEELETDMRLALTDHERASKLVGAGASELLRSASDAALSIRTQAERTAQELVERARQEATELVAQARQTIQAELRTAEETRTTLLEEAERSHADAIEEGKREGRALVQQAKQYAERLRREAEAQVAAHRDEVHALEQAAAELRGLLSRARALIDEVLQRQGASAHEPPLAPHRQPAGSASTRTPRTIPSEGQDAALAPIAAPSLDPQPASELETLTHLIEEVASVAEPATAGPNPAAEDRATPARTTQATTPAERSPAGPPEGTEDGGRPGEPATADEQSILGADEPADQQAEPGARVARLEELFRTLKAERSVAAPEGTEAGHAPVDGAAGTLEAPAPSAAVAEEGAEIGALEGSDAEAAALEAPGAEEELIDPALRQRIEELFSPLHLDLSRRVKRLVQDELNTLLATIRSSGRDGALSWLDAHDQAASARELAGLVHRLVATGHSLGEVQEEAEDRAEEATAAITRALVASLAELTLSRVKVALTEAEEDAELVTVANSLYREVRTRRLDELANDYAATAFCTGVRLTTRAIGFVWLTRSDTTPCADCEDNVLAGVNAVDELFPTGHENPPSHPGCTCLIAPVFA
jgi:hypothetical protein